VVAKECSSGRRNAAHQHHGRQLSSVKKSEVIEFARASRRFITRAGVMSLSSRGSFFFLFMRLATGRQHESSASFFAQNPPCYHIMSNTVRLQFRPCSEMRDPLEELDAGEPLNWEPIIMTLLLGARDMHSPLSLLRGKEEDIIQNISKLLIYKYKEGAVTITRPAYSVSRVETHNPNNDDEGELETFTTPYGTRHAVNVFVRDLCNFECLGRKITDRPQIAFAPISYVEFPEPTGIKINMMPFIMGDMESLPEEVKPYYNAIIAECPVNESEMGQVMYLTVHESEVDVNGTQRRPGLHIEAPSASVRHSGEFVAGMEDYRWGFGESFTGDEFLGGLYIASTISNTTAVWDALIDSKLGAVDTHGGIEHLRPFVGKGKKLPAGLLVWLTDRTPHEALPQERGGYRQFFRLVTADISIWFAAHSTPNPKVPVPSHVKIIGESKFHSANGSAAT